jgi:hypothetical protein
LQLQQQQYLKSAQLLAIHFGVAVDKKDTQARFCASGRNTSTVKVVYTMKHRAVVNALAVSAVAVAAAVLTAVAAVAVAYAVLAAAVAVFTVLAAVAVVALISAVTAVVAAAVLIE